MISNLYTTTASDLLDSVEVEFTLECIPCSTIVESHEATAEAAANAFAETGWSRNEEGEILCPDCK